MVDGPQQVNLAFRPFGLADVKLCYAWCQNQDVVRYLPSMPKPLSWANHERWALSALEHSGRADFMIDEGDWDGAVFETWSDHLPLRKTYGRVHATGLTSPSPEVGVVIGDTAMWGKGVATRAIAYMVMWLHDNGPWVQCHALILPENVASTMAFEKNGFVQRTPASLGPLTGRGGQLIFDKVIRP